MEYLAEVRYNTIQEYNAFEYNFQKGLLEIQKQHYNFKVERGSNGVVITHNFLTATIKLKPFPNDMPDEMKHKIIVLFQEHSRLYQQ